MTAHLYDVRELAGAVGDLGTFVPFVGVVLWQAPRHGWLRP